MGYLRFCTFCKSQSGTKGVVMRLEGPRVPLGQQVFVMGANPSRPNESLVCMSLEELEGGKFRFWFRGNSPTPAIAEGLWSLRDPHSPLELQLRNTCGNTELCIRLPTTQGAPTTCEFLQGGSPFASLGHTESGFEFWSQSCPMRSLHTGKFGETLADSISSEHQLLRVDCPVSIIGPDDCLLQTLQIGGRQSVCVRPEENVCPPSPIVMMLPDCGCHMMFKLGVVRLHLWNNLLAVIPHWGRSNCDPPIYALRWSLGPDRTLRVYDRDEHLSGYIQSIGQQSLRYVSST